MNRQDIRRGYAFKTILWLLVFCSAALIYNFSSETGETSSQTSGKVVEAVVKLTVSDYEKLQPTQKRQLIAAYQLPIRKTAHVLEFALLGLLLMFAWAQYPLRFSLRLTLSFTMALAVAILDETLQRGVSGRSSDFVDVGFDALGIILGAGLTLVFSRVRHGAKRKVKG